MRSDKRSDPVVRHRGHGSARRRARARPRLELLESRQVLSTLTVTSIADGGLPGDGTLRGEIAAAQPGDTIVFDPSLDTQTLTLTGGQLLINQSLTIQGPGADQLTVSGGGVSGVFQVAQGTNPVTVSGLTICKDALAGTGSYGGAIDNFGTLTVSGCTLTGNSATFGGAIENETGGTLTVSGCTISGNQAVYGGGIFNNGTASIVNTTVSGNYSGAGGGIDSGGPLSISGCTITGNRAASGGGIYTFGIPGTASIVNTTVSNNVAYAGDNNGEGGGIESEGGSYLTLQGCTFAGNGAGDYGGAIYVNDAGFKITGCTFTGNQAGQGLFGVGGNAIYIHSGRSGQLVVSHTTFGSGQDIVDFSNRRVTYGPGNTSS
jgi:predicted outer membrane repeat protein